MKKLVPVLGLVVAMFGLANTSPARAEEPPPVPAEVAACLLQHPLAVLLGQETAGPDEICLAYGEGMPGDSDWQDTYYPPGSTWTLTPTLPLDPELPIVSAPLPVPQQNPVLEVPQDVEVQALLEGSARMATLEVKVTYDRVKGARKYVVRCGENKKVTQRLRARLEGRAGDSCKVRAKNSSGLSPWSKKVRISG